MRPTRTLRLVALTASAALLASLVAATVAGPAVAARDVTCRGQAATIVGTPGDDVLVGTPGRDVIAGLGGDDFIAGGHGDDLICGGPGADRIAGNVGRDRVYGNAGPDRALGGRGSDRLFGGVGDDVLRGHAGDDRLEGGPGTDACYQSLGSGSKTSCELPARRTSGAYEIEIPGYDSRFHLDRRLVGGGFVRKWTLSSATGDYHEGYWWPDLELSDYCRTGGEPVGWPDSYWEYRFALEFQFAGVTDATRVTRATLTLRSASPGRSRHEVRGYRGNGRIEAFDTEVVGTPVTFEPGSDQYDLDVTSLVTAANLRDGWFGLSVRAADLAPEEDRTEQSWLCETVISDGRIVPLPPTLTIEYTMP